MIDLGGDLTVCICTRDRPDDLACAIDSVLRHARGASILVSDDGEASVAPVVGRFPGCTWQQGPKRGLGANRNAAVRSATTPWILFLDDDAQIGVTFVSALEKCLARLDTATRERTIVTGRERKNGVLISSRDVDFLGFQRRAYASGESIHTVVINATVWPRRLFNDVQFDDRLLYGSDEVDLSYTALAADYHIEACRNAINDHHPSPHGRVDYTLKAHASRLRVTMKLYWRLQRNRPKAAAYACAAPVHLLLSLLKREGFRGLVAFVSVVRLLVIRRPL